MIGILEQNRIVSIPLSSKVFAAYGMADGVDAKGGFNATVGAAVTFSTGVNGNAANFNAAVNSVITIPDNNVFTFNDGTNDKPFSVKFNLKLNNLTDQWLVNKRGGSAATDEWQIIYYQNRLQFGLNSADGNRTLIIMSTALTAGVSYSLVFTYDGSKLHTGQDIYVNGTKATLQANANVGVYSGMPNSTTPVKIGVSGMDSTFGRVNGQIDELYFF